MEVVRLRSLIALFLLALFLCGSSLFLSHYKAPSKRPFMSHTPSYNNPNQSIANQYCGEVLIERQPWNFHKRVISYSLFSNTQGVIPDYLMYGVQRNIKNAKMTYPDWILRLYVINVSQAFLDEMAKEETVEVVRCVPAGTHAKNMLWRFLVYDDPKVAISMPRDLDGRLTFREMFAVHEWLSSGLGFHTMRDHPRHSYPIMGGLFGMRRGVLGEEKMEDLITASLSKYPGLADIPAPSYVKLAHKEQFHDQNFLALDVWPKVNRQTLATDSFINRCFNASSCRDFPVGPRARFVGYPFRYSLGDNEQCSMTCVWS